MGLRDIELSLPAGFRFCPSDEELICHYLQKKVANEKVSQGTMVEVDLHTNEPWELPEVAKLGENEWYFFSFRDRKYATGPRTNRATKSGYWKATGKDRTVYHPKTGAVAGMRKTLVFYSGRAPNGTNTSWVMHEFRLQIPLNAPPKEDWVLCRVFHKKKGDPLMRYSLDQNEQDNSITSRFDCLPPQVDSSSLPQQDVQIPNGRMRHQQMTSLFPFVEHHEGNNNSNTYLDLHALLQCNFHCSPQEPETERMMQQIGTKAGGDDDDDDGGMMFDVNLDGHDLLLQGMDDFGGVSSVEGGKDQIFF